MTSATLSTLKIPKIKKKMPLIKGAGASDFGVIGSVLNYMAAAMANRADEYFRPTFSCYTLSNDKKNASSKKKKMNFRLLKRFAVKT